ncbi:MAG: dephospho-CoA kinase [Bacteroidales bacterium]|nr:dephospho-CoA kinase [Bacteroidales bacterium]
MLSQVFRSMDIPVYDADSKAKLLMNNNVQIKEALIENFGENTYTNGAINKEYLRKIVFGNEENRRLVNSIVHPAVKQDFIEWQQNTGTKITAIESAILFDAKLEDILDHIIFVDAPEDVMVGRICLRDKVSEDVAISKIRIQRKNSGREKCDYIFINDRDHSLIEQSEKFINALNK